MRLTIIILLLSLTTTLHAQEHILGMHLHDAVIYLGPEYTTTKDGAVTTLHYGAMIVNHPVVGKITEEDDYDFVNDVCEARHSYIPNSYKQAFIDYLNKEFGKGDRLWRGEHDTYIAIKDRGENFEMMVWTKVYEKVLDNR